MKPYYPAILTIIAVLLAYRIPVFSFLLWNTIIGGYLRQLGRKRSFITLILGLSLHLTVFCFVIWLIWSKYTPIGASLLLLLSIFIIGYQFNKKYRTSKLIRLIKTHEEKGFTISLYEDWQRKGFELRFVKVGLVVKKEFIPWLHEPKYGIDIEDRNQLEEITEKVVLQLSKLQENTIKESSN